MSMQATSTGLTDAEIGRSVQCTSAQSGARLSRSSSRRCQRRRLDEGRIDDLPRMLSAVPESRRSELMDAKRIETIARALIDETTRRQTLGGLLGGAMAALGVGGSWGREEAAAKKKKKKKSCKKRKQGKQGKQGRNTKRKPCKKPNTPPCPARAQSGLSGSQQRHLRLSAPGGERGHRRRRVRSPLRRRRRSRWHDLRRRQWQRAHPALQCDRRLPERVGKRVRFPHGHRGLPYRRHRLRLR